MVQDHGQTNTAILLVLLLGFILQAISRTTTNGRVSCMISFLNAVAATAAAMVTDGEQSTNLDFHTVAANQGLLGTVVQTHLPKHVRCKQGHDSTHLAHNNAVAA
jgi:hypothetical protein